MANPIDQGTKSSWAVRLLKFLILTFLFGSALYFFWSSASYFFSEGKRLDFAARVFFGGFMLFLAVCTGLIGYGIWKEAPLKGSASSNSNSQFPLLDWAPKLREIRPTKLADFEESALQQKMIAGDFHGVIDHCDNLIQTDPNDLVILLYRICALLSLKDVRVETALRSFAAKIPEHEVLIQAGIAELQAWEALNRSDVVLFLAALKKFLDSEYPQPKKVSMLDAVACTFLYAEHCDDWGTAEFCARKAVELAPDLSTIKGTLGGVLVEKGELAEAEPLLTECYQKSALRHDQGISAYFLARIDEQRGETDHAKRWAHLSIELFSPPWLTKKVNDLLVRVGG